MSNTDHPFVVGDVVELKSGGPPMTIEKFDSYADGTVAVHCVWFDGITRHDGVFTVHLIEKHDPFLDDPAWVGRTL